MDGVDKYENRSMKAAHHSLQRTRPQARGPGRRQTFGSLQNNKTMHCGCLLPLVLGIFVALTSGRALPKYSEMQSIIEDLHVMLEKCNIALKENTHLKDLQDMEDLKVEPCQETPVHLNQSDTLAHRLTQYHQCKNWLKDLCPGEVTNIVIHNKELLTHLKGLDQVPTLSSVSTSTLFDTERKSIQCVDCWIQQVEALRR